MQTTLRFAPVPRLGFVLLIVLAVLAAAGIAVLAIGSRHERPAPPFGPARNGAVVYGGGDHDIYGMDPVSGATSALVAGASGDRAPTMSPDGSQFLFLRDSTVLIPATVSYEPILMVADADGSAIRPLTGALANFQGSTWARTVAWSSDGSRVAVAADVNGMPKIQILTVDRASDPVVINLPGAAYYLSFRPGDQELTFLADKGTSNGLYAVGVDGHGFRTILEPASADYASLSPDGTKLAYQSISASATPYAVVKVIDVDSGEVTTPAFEPGAISADDDPSWSPDGRVLLFQRYNNGTYRMAVAPVAGGRVVEIGPTRPQNGGGERVGAQFSPDGSTVIAHYDGNGSTWLLDPTGVTAGTELAATMIDTPSWQRRAP